MQFKHAWKGKANFYNLAGKIRNTQLGEAKNVDHGQFFLVTARIVQKPVDSFAKQIDWMVSTWYEFFWKALTNRS